MKYYYLLCLSLLVSCTNSSPQNTGDNKGEKREIGEHDYSEIVDRKIAWEETFSQEPYQYYCYIYSETCSHCNKIKNVVIDYALNHAGIYFVEFKKNIPLLNDVSRTIGATDIEHAGILGTPTLYYLINHTLIENIAGSQNVVKKLENNW